MQALTDIKVYRCISKLKKHAQTNPRKAQMYIAPVMVAKKAELLTEAQTRVYADVRETVISLFPVGVNKENVELDAAHVLKSEFSTAFTTPYEAMKMNQMFGYDIPEVL